MYQKFLASTLTKKVAGQRYDYWLQLIEATRTSVLSPKEDSDSENNKEEEGGGKDGATIL